MRCLYLSNNGGKASGSELHAARVRYFRAPFAMCSFFALITKRFRGDQDVWAGLWHPKVVSVGMCRPCWRCPHPPLSLTLGALPHTPLARGLLGVAPLN